MDMLSGIPSAINPNIHNSIKIKSDKNVWILPETHHEILVQPRQLKNHVNVKHQLTISNVSIHTQFEKKV